MNPCSLPYLHLTCWIIDFSIQGHWSFYIGQNGSGGGQGFYEPWLSRKVFISAQKYCGHHVHAFIYQGFS